MSLEMKPGTKVDAKIAKWLEKAIPVAGGYLFLGSHRPDLNHPDTQELIEKIKASLLSMGAPNQHDLSDLSDPSDR